MKKSLLVKMLVALAFVWGCSVNAPDTSSNAPDTSSDISDINSEVAGTLTVELDVGQNKSKSVIEVEELDILGATIALTNSAGEGEVKTWKPGDSFVYTFQAKKTGLHTLTVVDWDKAGHTNVESVQINIRNGKNYRVKVQLGGKIYIEPVAGVIPRDGLVAEYLFNGNALDTSGNGNNGTLLSGSYPLPSLTADRHENSNSAYYFAGTGGTINVLGPMIDCGNEASITNIQNAISVSVWIKSYSSRGRIIGRHANDLRAGWDIYLDNNKVLAEIGSPDAVGHPELSKTITNNLVSVSTNNFYHIVFTFDKQLGKAQLYVNNQKVEATGWGNGVLTYLPYEMNPFPEDHLTIATFCAWGTSYFNGVIDDVRIYNRILSDEEVKALYEE